MDNNKLMEKVNKMEAMLYDIRKEIAKTEVVKALRDISHKSFEHDDALKELMGEKNYRRYIRYIRR